MARTILVPLDGSPAAETILPEVARVFPAGGKVHLIRLCPSKSDREAAEYVARVRRRAFPGSSGLDLVRPGKPADGILRAALEKNIDLIAMTTHARRGLARQMLGSVAAEVVRKSQLPVLLTRPDTRAPGKSIRRILVPIDGARAPTDLLETVKFLCPEGRAEVLLLRVIPPVSDPAPQWASGASFSELASPSHRLQELADKLEDEGYYAWPITSAGRPEDEILGHCTRLDVDLIAMSTHGRSGLERLLEGSVSEKVLSRSPVAVLLQKPLVIHPAVPAGEVGP
jgi:nucleotide-binding universal stress UspA family protein